MAGDLELSLRPRPDLRRQHGLTYWAIDRARMMFNIRRKRGAGSTAYKKSSAARLR